MAHRLHQSLSQRRVRLVRAESSLYVQSNWAYTLGAANLFLPLHSTGYEKANKIDYFKQYFTDAHDNSAYGNADIWVGEFKATEGSDEEKKQFYKDAVTWMESQPWIKGALFWFSKCFLKQKPD